MGAYRLNTELSCTWVVLLHIVQLGRGGEGRDFAYVSRNVSVGRGDFLLQVACDTI